MSTGSSPTPSQAAEEPNTPSSPKSEPSVADEPEASTSQSPSTPQDTPADDPSAANTWQAIFSPPHSAYYFYNTITQETTWVNPLQPNSSASTSSADPDGDNPPQDPSSTSSTSTPAYTALQQAAIAQGIDPSLAHLDPSLVSSSNPAAAIDGSNPTFTAKFNARTGTFTRADARDPSHLSEYERAKRMSEFYFDVNEWENQREGEMDDQNTKKRKRPTKKDLERFKEQKRLKKIAKTAWLRQ